MAGYRISWGRSGFSQLTGSLSAMAIAMVVSIILGIISSKLIAHLAGTAGVGLIGLYRSLGQFIALILALEMTTVVVQRAASARLPDELRAVFVSTWRLFLLQVLAVLVIAAIGAAPLTWMLFGNQAASHLVQVQLVILMVIGLLAHRAVLALMEGRVMVRTMVTFTVFTSVLTLISVYPLLLLGDIGIAMICGASCLVMAPLGVRPLVSAYHVKAHDWYQSFSIRARPRALPVSTILTMRSIVTSAALLALQAAVLRFYGTEQLGLFNAASMVESSFFLILVSSMRSYCLPALARLTQEVEKKTLINQSLLLLLIIVLPGVSYFILWGQPLLVLLLTPQFAAASTLLTILSLSLVPQTVARLAAVVVLDRLEYKCHFLIDTLWSVLLITGIAICLFLDLTITAIAFVYLIVHLVTAVMYLIILQRRYGAILTEHSLWLLLGVSSWIGVTYLIRNTSSLVTGIFSIATILITCLMIYLMARIRLFQHSP